MIHALELGPVRRIAVASGLMIVLVGAPRIDGILRRSRVGHRDELTGLPNRKAFDEHLDTMLARAGKGEIALVLLDLDDFKLINESRGHAEGDRVLRDVSRVALRELRVGEDLFRTGGEKFAIVLSADEEAGVLVAERVRSAVRGQRRKELLPTLSAGVASFPTGASSKDELLKRADLALRAAKRSGKNRVFSSRDATPSASA